MKYCKQCDCMLPDDYEDDFCPVCLEDMGDYRPDMVRADEEDS